jgi:drug/metabolite transporter (DMT)-like permease
MSNITKGIYISLATAVISGVSIFINKFAVDAVKPALYFTSVKNVAVALLIVTIVLATGEWKKIAKLSKKELGYLLLIGIIGGSLPFYLYFTGLSQTPAVNAAIIHKTLVFWVMLMAIPFLKEKVSKWQILGVLMLFAGNVFVGGFKGFKFSQGELMLLVATVLWAVENILAKKVLATVSPNIVTAFRMGLGSIVLMSATIITVPQVLQKSLALSNEQFLYMGLTVLFLLAYTTTWYRALKHAPAVVVTSVLVSSTLVTNVLSAVFVTHSWNVTLTVQALLIVAGLFIFSKSALNQPKPSTITTL